MGTIKKQTMNTEVVEFENKPLADNQVKWVENFMDEKNIAEGGENKIFFRDGFQTGVNYRNIYVECLKVALRKAEAELARVNAINHQKQTFFFLE